MDAKLELTKELLGLFPGQEERMREVLKRYAVAREHDPGPCGLEKRVEQFLNAKRIDGLSDKTLKEYRCKLLLFVRRVKKLVVKVTANDIRNYITYLVRERGLKESSVQTHISTLRSFFNWLGMEGVMKKNPMCKIKSAKIDRGSTRRPLTAEELEHLRNACRTYKEKALVEFLVSSGCRLSEVTGITLPKIDWQERSVTVHGKGNKDRKVYFSVRAKLMLEEYIKQRKGGTALFASHRAPYGPMQARAIQKALHKLGERAAESRRVYPHLMRHTFATNALNSGMDITVIQRLLGHTDPKTTLIYAELSPRTVQYEYEKIIA